MKASIKKQIEDPLKISRQVDREVEIDFILNQPS
jgi:hypothetical protein